MGDQAREFGTLSASKTPIDNFGHKYYEFRNKLYQHSHSSNCARCTGCPQYLTPLIQLYVC